MSGVSVNHNPTTNSLPRGPSRRGPSSREQGLAGLTVSWAPVEIEEIRRQLTSILASSIFARSHRQSRLLSHIVQATLSGDAHRLNQRIIGIEVFDRPES